MSPDERKEVLAHGEPTKDFFIRMLTKDIELVPAIADLVDNSIDGARRVRGENFDGLHVNLRIARDLFEISDNCGGIRLDTARNYAFKFGRDPRARSVEHSIGQFGVGMKRALFKIGREFFVLSRAEDGAFLLDITVDQWRERKDWSFPLLLVPDSDPSFPPEQGTTIRITDLGETATSQFALEAFEPTLREGLESRYQVPISRGLAISLNGRPLSSPQPTLLASERLQPAYEELRLKDDVFVRLYAGVVKQPPGAATREAGWYVYCNDRLVLGADQTTATGWGTRGPGTSVPRFHGQFAQFRGYAFMTAREASRLPWNTTKTGVEVDHPVYRAVRQRMGVLMRPVITFLNKLDAERDHIGNGFLDAELEEASAVPIGDLRPSRFLYPEPEPEKSRPAEGRIAYRKPSTDIREAKQLLGVRTNAEVGEKTFEYYLRAEGDHH